MIYYIEVHSNKPRLHQTEIDMYIFCLGEGWRRPTSCEIFALHYHYVDVWAARRRTTFEPNSAFAVNLAVAVRTINPCLFRKLLYLIGFKRSLLRIEDGKYDGILD